MDTGRLLRSLPALLAAGAVALLGAGVVTVATHAGGTEAAPVVHAGDHPGGHGGGHGAGHGAGHGTGHGTGHGEPGRSVTDLTGPRDGEPDVRFTLTARHAPVGGVDALTFDGTAPGPELRVRAGQLVEVELRNADVEEGVTLHWHGLDVPNAEDGVAGVTQDAVAPGGTHVYRFRPEQAGSYWYHSHQDSARTVARGLFGALVVEPAGGGGPDAVLLAHTFPDPGAVTEPVIDGPVRRDPVERVRIVNTDSTTQTWAVDGAPFTVLAIDGTDLTGPTPLDGAVLRVPAGGRVDVGLAGPATVGLVDGPSVGFGVDPVPLTGGGPEFDPLAYGTPAAPETGPFDRELLQVLDTERVTRRGVPSVVWTINGSLDPEPATVAEGELVRVTIRNDGTDAHPMHLHGHHVRVLSRDGVPATGSAWWTDSLDVGPGETFEVAFRADNPGIWMDHCHNLNHAAAGMVMHLTYEGVSTPFRHDGGAGNTPE
ncbi:multicopper oxidase family protein [Pseudonocardia broussonetiae]|uniref:Multicopper oxidase family protein n=1 Tax=Pseudonocardia broussonetiae TaxID=2736640 RepID=A0A6M6JJ61_9PSEU|nr:multicopper oxidase family protein [Pseudonocardia broussonetiae]QJY46957.1 multicopper oxidase family protein [Pseudonocardia broussonetiae]